MPHLAEGGFDGAGQAGAVGEWGGEDLLTQAGTQLAEVREVGRKLPGQADIVVGGVGHELGQAGGGPSVPLRYCRAIAKASGSRWRRT